MKATVFPVRRTLKNSTLLVSAWNAVWVIIAFWVSGGKTNTFNILHYNALNFPLEAGEIAAEFAVVVIFVILSSPIWGAPYWLCLVKRSPWKNLSTILLSIWFASTLVALLHNLATHSGQNYWVLYYLVESIFLAQIVAIKIIFNSQ